MPPRTCPRVLNILLSLSRPQASTACWPGATGQPFCLACSWGLCLTDTKHPSQQPPCFRLCKSEAGLRDASHPSWATSDSSVCGVLDTVWIWPLGLSNKPGSLASGCAP